MYHFGVVRTPIPIPKAMKIPTAQAAVDKERDKLNNLPACSESKVRAQADVIHEAQNKRVQYNVDSFTPLEALRVGENTYKNKEHPRLSWLRKFWTQFGVYPATVGEAHHAVSAHKGTPPDYSKFRRRSASQIGQGSPGIVVQRTGT